MKRKMSILVVTTFLISTACAKEDAAETATAPAAKPSAAVETTNTSTANQAPAEQTANTEPSAASRPAEVVAQANAAQADTAQAEPARENGSAAPAAQSETSAYREGLHYTAINDADSVIDSDKVVVIEAFSYRCPGCFGFEPYIKNWVKKQSKDVVEFRRIPMVFQASWEPFARAYITAEMMGVDDIAHQQLWDAIYKERRQLRNINDLADYYSEYDLDKSKFLATAKSFAVDAELRNTQIQAQKYGVNVTPTLIVNGKYRLQSGRALPSGDSVIEALDYLVKREAAAAGN